MSDTEKTFPVIIITKESGSTKMHLVEAEGLPMDIPFEIFAHNANEEMLTLAKKAYNKAWKECQDNYSQE